jgi:hypothetical protein
VQKLKSAPNGFTLRVKAEIEKIFSICPKLLINANFMALYWPQLPRLKKDTNELGSQFATHGANVPTFINFLTSMS